MRQLAGISAPLGATYDGKGVNFALFSENATGVELCIFDSVDSTQESHRIPLQEKTDFIWHGYFPDLKPGTLYGYRVTGTYDVDRGHRFNPSMVLMDPYAKAIARRPIRDKSNYSYKMGHRLLDQVRAEEDNAATCGLSMVVDPADLEPVRPVVKKPWKDTFIYEVHVKGFTMLHQELPEEIRGTYAGMGHPSVVAHLKDLGVTAVELLPVHIYMNEDHLVEKGLSNYWGYNTLNFFYPEPSYAHAKDPIGIIREFRQMVSALHDAGIEVILDVVYNHTAEGNGLGATYHYRGIDNDVYYRLNHENKRFYINYTGCGNTLNFASHTVMRLAMDSLRYWATDMGVDGFRFDLAVTLGRVKKSFERLGPFFAMVRQDPVLAMKKIIAEPWDLGPEGHQAGAFPAPWSEWNDRFRDTIRSFWRGDEGKLPEFATRFSGSSDYYGISGRGPRASINYICSHDGFTLEDLVSYEYKHNESNGENNQDGQNDNLSRNWGAEGITQDPDVMNLRDRVKRNMMATLFLSQGVPMILSGDELGRSQRGNNNAYCQDNEISWLNWNLKPHQKNFLKFTQDLVRLRMESRLFRRNKYFSPAKDGSVPDVVWLKEDGSQMNEKDWSETGRKVLGVELPYEDQGEEAGERAALLLMNPSSGQVHFVMPAGNWVRKFDTRLQFMDEKPLSISGETPYPLMEYSMALFELEGA